MNELTILCIFAHPDDECFMCGGTLAALAGRGYRVVLVTCTGGENSTQVGRRLSKAALKRVRRRELQRSSKILGIDKIVMLGYPDQRLRQVSEEKLIRQLQQFFKRFQPRLVLTFTPDGVSDHGDHQAISYFTSKALHAWQEAPLSPPTLCLFGFPNTFRRRVNLPLVKNQRFVKLDVRQYVQRKLHAITMHASQVKTMERFRHLTSSALRKLFRFEYLLRVDSRSLPTDFRFLVRQKR